MTAIGQRVGASMRARAARRGNPPRSAYEHYFIESEGLHSRIHLQNFWSTFWPQIDEPATAHLRVLAADGSELGRTDRELPRFGSLFLELRELLSEIGAIDVPEGTVAIDLEPSAGVREQFGDLPDPEKLQVKTPFWMAYYDASENYMYVHSIDTLGGEVFGTPRSVAWPLTRSQPPGAKWLSWRLLDVENLSDLQVVATNSSPEPRSTTVGIYSADGEVPLFEQQLDLGPRQLHRLRVPAEQLAEWPQRHPELTYVRIGVSPLMTANGKPYVLMRYGDGPLSVHHG